ncbi:gamma-glutamylcyclotransferase [Roseibium aquae]|uniref:Gamma-glutamylcyclotransferase n=1 Tax=Roseibium aquae TaxID=1323746 RepID=A0A916TES1_9HYPH|nr:gamma-glutamylcyclotransferase family protein [Roseibium aquae]GGB42562.1 gamma-glutamylcyclotransferase [Roseibium aquae]
MAITFFGYGSLVNAATLGRDVELVPGRLSGWVRAWRVCGTSSAGRGVCVLTVHRRAGAQIEGALARQPADRLPALLQREHKYDPIPGIGAAFRADGTGEPGPEDSFLFQVKDRYARWGDADHPIYQSYLDCVLAGYFGTFGWDGVRRFLETTEGWHVPVLPDRENPLYARAVTLTAELREGIDDVLAEHGVRYLQQR